MRLALVALALTLPAASSAEAPGSQAAPASRALASPSSASLPSRICANDLRPRTARSPDSAKLRRLGELPPGDLTLTVVNQVGDCIEPVVVRQGYGGLDSRPGR